MSRKASIVNLCPCILTRGRLKHIGTEGNDVPLYKLIVPRESKKNDKSTTEKQREGLILKC